MDRRDETTRQLGFNPAPGVRPAADGPPRQSRDNHEPVEWPALHTHKRLLIAWLFVPLHLLLLRLSGGRLLGRLEGEGVLILVTKGRKTGRLRSSPLIYFQFEEPGELIVVASNYGQGHHPAWYLNIAADANVAVETEGARHAAKARITRGQERDALFDKVAAANPRFAIYRAGTHRKIPVVAIRRTQSNASWTIV